MILFFCERLLHRPSLGGTVGLGASIAVSLLSASPQVIVYTYQLVALRVVFEYATRRPKASGRRWRQSPAVSCSVPSRRGTPVPGLQTAAASVRAGGLGWTDMQPELSVDLTSLHLALMQRADGYKSDHRDSVRARQRQLAVRLDAAIRAVLRRRRRAHMFVLAFGPAHAAVSVARSCRSTCSARRIASSG
jgi:hypothetical protein